MFRVDFNVFEGFKCLNKECKRSCCIGWQVDLDKPTVKKYAKLCKKDSPIQDRLQSKIDRKNKSIVMNSDGRCPFLNENNLCDIIIYEGENAISQTCKLHPRFINEIGQRQEVGFGLSCQKALELLLNCKDFFKETPNSNDPKKIKPTKLEKEILKAREKAYAIIIDEEKTFNQKVFELCANLEFLPTQNDILDYAKFLLTLERLDEQWTKILQNFIKEFCPQNELIYFDLPIDKGVQFANLLCYFIYRHLPNSIDKTDISSRIIFAINSATFIYYCWCSQEKTEQALFDVIRNYCAEIEYSFDNLNATLDYVEEQKIKKKYL